MAHPGRREERIPVYSPGRIIWAKDLSKPLNCVLIDVSGSGAKLKVDEPLGADEVVVVHLDLHLLLLEVRYCLARPGTYWVGARRIHSMPAFQISDDATDRERLRLLLADFEEARRAAAPETVWPAALSDWVASIGASAPAETPAPAPASESVLDPAPPRALEPPAGREASLEGRPEPRLAAMSELEPAGKAEPKPAAIPEVREVKETKEDQFWMPGEPAGWRPAPLGFVAPSGQPVTPDLNARAAELLERLRHWE